MHINKTLWARELVSHKSYHIYQKTTEDDRQIPNQTTICESREEERRLEAGKHMKNL